MHSFWDQLQEV